MLSGKVWGCGLDFSGRANVYQSFSNKARIAKTDRIYTVNNVLGFYDQVLKLLRMVDGRPRKVLLKKIMADVPKGVSWEWNEQKFRELMRYHYDVTELEPLSHTRKEFILATFRDLAPINSRCRCRVFRGLRNVCGIDKSAAFAFAIKVPKITGSWSTIIIHTSSKPDLDRIMRFAGDASVHELIDIYHGAML